MPFLTKKAGSFIFFHFRGKVWYHYGILRYMKKIISVAVLFSIIIFSACKKAATDNPDINITVRYQFTATLAGNFNFEIKTDSLFFTETVNTANWTKTVNVTNNINRSDTARFTVFPPLDWYGTPNRADGTLKIFINDVEKASVTNLFVGIDRPVGTTIMAYY